MTDTNASAAPARTCPECGRTFHSNHKGKVFCSETCRVAYANLALTRGKPIVPLAITWRRNRDTEIGKAALREMCRIIAGYIEEDRADERDCAIQVEALLGGFHVKKHDRRPNLARKMSKTLAAAHA